MKKGILLSILATSVFAQVNLIIDTDAGLDVDDIGALAVAHHLADQGKANILATIHCTGFELGIAAVNIINTYYGRPDTPLGAYKGPFGAQYGMQNKYAQDLIDNFPNGGIFSSEDVQDALEIYVDVLKAQPDNSVTIASIGIPINIRNLLREQPDLFHQKVKEVYYMDGPYNFGCGTVLLGDTDDCFGCAQEVQEKFPHTSTKEYFQSNGADMCTAGGLYSGQCSDQTNPVQRAYYDWISKAKVTNACPGARSSWDLLTVYAAIMGSEGSQMTERVGTNTVTKRGREKWDYNQTGSNEVNLIFNDDYKKEAVTQILENILCAGKSELGAFLQ